jgi:hypothetical protein
LIRLKQVADMKTALANHIQHGQGYGSVVLVDQMFGRGDSRVPRVVTCEKLKGDTHFTEYRYYETEKLPVRCPPRPFPTYKGRA